MTGHLANRQAIVVGVDGSPTSLGALEWAAAIADRVGAPLKIVNALCEPSYYFDAGAILTHHKVSDHARRDSTEILDEARLLVAEQHPALDVETEMRSGPADLVLVDLSTAARLVVVGSHRHGSIGSALIGSTTLRVAHHAESPVVVWRRANRHRITDHAPVLVGVDGSELSNFAVEQAFDLASVLAAPLIAAHTWTVDSGDTVAQGERALLSECLAGWTEKYPDVDVTQIAVEGTAADLLSDYSRDSQLVIVGSHGRSRIASALLGSTSQQLLGQSHAPLMICRGRHGTTTLQ